MIFGYNTAGASTASVGANQLIGTKHTAPANGTITKFTAYIDTAGGSGRHFKIALVDAATKTIVGISDPSASVSTVAPGWVDANCSTPINIVSGTDYYMCFVNSSTLRENYDDIGGAGTGVINDSSNNYSSPTDPTDGNVITGRKYSIYATYTPSVIDTRVEPGAASLGLTTYEPSVSATTNVVVPHIAELSLETFEPSIELTHHQRVTPDLATLSLETFEPTATATTNAIARPLTATLVLVTYKPKVKATFPPTPVDMMFTTEGKPALVLDSDIILVL
jgi:hypothetical protein